MLDLFDQMIADTDVVVDDLAGKNPDDVLVEPGLQVAIAAQQGVEEAALQDEQAAGLACYDGSAAGVAGYETHLADGGNGV